MYDAKITYKKKYANEASDASKTGAIDDYEKALLIEIIYYNYYYKVFIIAHDVRDI